MSSIHRSDFRVYCSPINKREALQACIASLFPFHAMSFYVQRYSPNSHPMPMIPEDTRLHPLETTCPPPHRFTCPFHYEPHPLCRMAAQQVQNKQFHNSAAHIFINVFFPFRHEKSILEKIISRTCLFVNTFLKIVC